MGWRFRKSVKILPGVRLNFSRSGISTSLGVPGATLNLGRGKRTLTTGLPGTGLSHSQSLMGGSDGTGPAPKARSSGTGCVVWIGAIIALLLGVSMCRAPDASPPAGVAVPIGSPSAAAQPVDILYVDTANLNVRSEASTQSAIVASLARGQAVQVAERRDGWAKIVHGAAFAWVATRYLSDTARAAPLPAADRPRPQPLIRENGGGRCSCRSNQVCTGPRGGRYCITGSGNKRYGV